jgi:hypothetical protein
VLTKGSTAIYTYDFGDGWLHDIVVENVLPFDPGKAIPNWLKETLGIAAKKFGPEAVQSHRHQQSPDTALPVGRASHPARPRAGLNLPRYSPRGPLWQS